MLPSARVVYSVVCGFQFVSMALLIIACVTAPTFKQIGLSKYSGTTYGVFGYCDDQGCSKVSAFYKPYEVGSDSDSDWKISARGRKVLGKILIVTPIAAGLSFLGFLSTVVSFVGALVSGSSNAVLFTLNLTMTVIAFLGSALVCVIVFLLFYPHVTWCSWILIPSAALLLITIPLVFVAHSSSRSGGEDDDERDDDLTGIIQHDDVEGFDFESPKEAGFYKEVTNPSGSLVEKPLMADPYTNNDSRKQESVVKISSGTTDQSSATGHDLNDFGPETNSHTAFSAINDNNNGARPKVSLSMASSEYSSSYAQNQYSKEPRGVLEDIIKDSISKDETTEAQLRSVSDNASDFTSISQRAPRQQVIPPANQFQQVVPPASQYQQPYQQPYQQQTHQYQPQQQRAYPTTRSAGPDPTDMLLQNNPNFIQTNARRMQPQQQYYPQQYSQRAPNSYDGFQGNVNPALNQGGFSSTHYKPAYKKKVGARNNMIPPASAIRDGNPYQFR